MKRKNESKRQKEGRKTQKKSLLSTLTDYLPRFNSWRSRWRDCLCIRSKPDVTTTSLNVSKGSLVAFKAKNDKQNETILLKTTAKRVYVVQNVLISVAMATGTGSTENAMTIRAEEGILLIKQSHDKQTDQNI